MSIYFTSYYPLSCTAEGRFAVEKYNLPPFIDGSCRREPDFEKNRPCITGLCRPGFSKKLRRGDVVVYTTNKKGLEEKKLVAILEVILEPIIGHEKASKWYFDNGFDLPNNLMIDQNPPFQLDKTHQMGGWDAWMNKTDTLEDWDNGYKQRASEHPEVAICKIWNGQLYLNNPPSLSDQAMGEIFGRKTLTRNPPKLESGQWERLLLTIGLTTIES